MHIHQIRLMNIRGIAELDWVIPLGDGPGWHVVIGDNGSGKTTFLRAVALALIGASEAEALRETWSSWLRHGAHVGFVNVHLNPDPTFDRFSGKGKKLTKYYGKAFVGFDRTEDNEVVLSPGNTTNPSRHVWGSGDGWFSASYGPFRRFAGGDKDAEKLYYSKPRLARHLSVFGENIALTECLSWLQSLRFKQLEREPEGALLNSIKTFVNQKDFLPHGAKLTNVTSKAVLFVDGNDVPISVNELSDGYRSILSLTFELIRQLALTYSYSDIFSLDSTTVVVPGVVLIDEVDAHLHPTWQQRIGQWLTRHFPQMQFVVTTHSPLVCQAAEKGSIFLLPRPGVDGTGEMIKGYKRDRLLYGNVLDAYSTEVFGTQVGRSESGQTHLKRLAELNIKELNEGLTAAEKAEREALRRAMPTEQHVVGDMGAKGK